VDPDDHERIVLGVLLEHHPMLLTLDQIRECVWTDVPLQQTLETLVEDGMATGIRGLYGPSWAMLRADQIRRI
jgi:hypothetical protein